MKWFKPGYVLHTAAEVPAVDELSQMSSSSHTSSRQLKSEVADEDVDMDEHLELPEMAANPRKLCQQFSSELKKKFQVWRAHIYKTDRIRECAAGYNDSVPSFFLNSTRITEEILGFRHGDCDLESNEYGSEWVYFALIFSLTFLSLNCCIINVFRDVSRWWRFTTSSLLRQCSSMSPPSVFSLTNTGQLVYFSAMNKPFFN